MNTAGDPIEILLVEDNPGDAELVRHGLRAGKIEGLAPGDFGPELHGPTMWGREGTPGEASTRVGTATG